MKNKFMSTVFAVIMANFFFVSIGCNESSNNEVSNNGSSNKGSYDGPALGKWHGKSQMVATGTGFLDTYEEMEFFKNGTLILRKYEGDKVVKESRGTFNGTNSTFEIEGSKYHGSAYEIRNGFLYLTAFNSANQKVQFDAFYKE